VLKFYIPQPLLWVNYPQDPLLKLRLHQPHLQAEAHLAEVLVEAQAVRLRLAEEALAEAIKAVQRVADQEVAADQAAIQGAAVVAEILAVIRPLRLQWWLQIKLPLFKEDRLWVPLA
jgi:hypothetical protein